MNLATIHLSLEDPKSRGRIPHRRTFVGVRAIYFRDIYDHLAKFFEVVEICRELIASIMEIHLSIISNQTALVGNKTNHVMRRLTLITMVFMPLTLLAGIERMSEWTMMTGPQNWKIAYQAFFVLMGIIAVDGANDHSPHPPFPGRNREVRCRI